MSASWAVQKSKISSILKCQLLLFYTTMNHFSIRLWLCNKKWILYDKQQWPAQSLDQKEAPKHFPKANLHYEKVMVTVWWFAAGLIHYSFLNSGETTTSEKYAQQIDEMHWKLQCLQPALANRMGPVLHTTLDHMSRNQCFKSWTN